MHLSAVNIAMNHQITSGSEYCWQCYGENARHLDYVSEFADVTVIYDATNQRVYEAMVYSKINTDTEMYRWIDPYHRGAFETECANRKVDAHAAWDDATWIDLEVEEDWLEKASAIFNNLPYDKDVLVPIDLDDAVLLSLAMEAHRRNMTLNAYVNEIMRKYISEVNEAVA